jgi:6-phosphogluconolactonase (cycloisomerase 2 family)
MSRDYAAHFGGIRYPFQADKLSLFMAIGADLIHAEIDRDDMELRHLHQVTLAAPIQYVWPHPDRNILYVATSNRSISPDDDCHTLATVSVDNKTGKFDVLAEVMLPTRPIHLTVDTHARNVLVVYNAPSLITCHPIDSAGMAGRALDTDASPSPWSGIFPHQVLMLPDTQVAVVVARGNHPRGNRPEEPGSLELISVGDEGLKHVETVAPNGGFGFGPRHLAFHPNGRWAAVALERQNMLHIFRVEGDRIAAEPIAQVSTVSDDLADEGISQLAGTLRFHPSGDYLYVVNRNDNAVYKETEAPSSYSGNNIAVFGFDPESGHATCIQHIPTESVHVRTISLDVSGNVLVAASILPGKVMRDGVEENLPARLSCFRVDGDGRLTLVRVHDQGNEDLSLFWSHLNGCG